ncbi:hypothetical protein PEP31012_01761 [Pandoraea eparura]|jgi:hypothetical protein|uniref:Glycerophosphoryl diester phosphodiesterase membrane domain-containing protein n=1 Tax=Pandoraea eparura TaxID=2508291 RepID=A0A5E4U2E4_9BURK|nr:hypothetical protein [Pandoraea eparura]VVD94210.1 hypothetical protein PEP31012_01761 [Pandoraea eparura]
MDPITFKQCFKGAWRDGFNALRQRPWLCLAIAVVFLVTAGLSISLDQLARTASQTGEPAIYRLRIALMSFGVFFANLVAFSVLVIHVFRYTILGPEAARQGRWYGRDLWRYLWASTQIFVAFAGVWLVIALGAALALRATGHSNSYAGLATFCVLLICALAYVLVRVSLIFAQIGAGRSKRWRAAWRDSRGHFWSMFGTMIGTVLPLMIAGGVVSALFAALLHVMPAAKTAALGMLVLQTVLSVMWIAVSTGTSAWLYRRFASELLTLDDAPDDV